MNNISILIVEDEKSISDIVKNYLIRDGYNVFQAFDGLEALKIFDNEDIDLKTRSIITVVALMAQGITDSSLKFHLQNAKDHGVTQKEIAAIITHVAFYAGWPKGWAVFNLAKEVWNEDETEE